MLAVGSSDVKPPLAAGSDTVLLHRPLHALLTRADALRPQLPPDARPAVGPRFSA
jgi:hypothetical protein